VTRLALRPYFALLLLLCLTRTLLPEAWVLALHAHEHTTEELAFAPKGPASTSKGQALLTAKHTHCQTEQFYNVPFRAALPVVVPQPQRLLRYCPLATPATLASSAAVLRRTALRGPPVAWAPLG
jgi:hypothetical protein